MKKQEKLKVFAGIAYKIKEGHKDAPASDEIQFYDDVYILDLSKTDGLTDGMREYISEDLKLIAGGGYDWKYIDVIKILIKPLTSL